MMPEHTAVPAGRWQYPLLLLLVVTLPLSEGLKNIAFAGLLLAVVAGRQWRGGGWLLREPLAWGLAAYLFAVAAATLASPEPAVSVKGLLDVFRFAAVYFIAAGSGLRREQVRGVLWALWLALVFGALMALPGLVAGSYHYLEINSLGQFNHTAIYLVQALLPLLALVMLGYQRRYPTGWLAQLLLLALALALALTASRAAWCVAAVMVAVLAARHQRNLRIAAISCLLLLLLGLAAMYYLPEAQWHALKNKFRTAQSLHMRVAIWKNALRSFSEHPLLGIGPERFGKIDFAGYGSSPEGHAPHGHNLFVQTVVTSGTAGLAALVFMLATALHSWWRARALTADDIWGQALWYGAGGGIMVVVGVGMLNTTLHHEHGMLFCLLLGLLVAWRRAEPGARIMLVSCDMRTGGIARVATELARAFTADGLVVATLAAPRPLATIAARMRFAIHTLAMLLQAMPEGIIALQWRPDGRLAQFARRWFGIPYLVYLHGKEAVPARDREQRQLRAVLRAAVRGVAVSNATAVAVRTVTEASNIVIVPNGTTGAALVDLPVAVGREKLVLAVGRLVPRKGFDVLLRAMAALPASGWRLVIIGDGSQRAELKALAQELGLDPAAVLVGEVDEASLWRWYRRAGIFVLPALAAPDAFEGLGIVLLEAAAAGVPLVGTDAGGVPEIICDGENGRLVPPGDAVALARVLGELIGDATLRGRLGEAARATAQRFDWRANARQLAGWLDCAAGGGGAPVPGVSMPQSVSRAGRPRVALLCLRYPPALGGVEMVVRAQAEILREWYEVAVFTTDLLNHKTMQHGAAPEYEEQEGVTIFRLSCHYLPGICYPIVPDMAQRLADWRPVVVHAHSLWYYPVWCGWRYARRTGIPFILQPHYDRKPHWFFRSYRRLLLDRITEQATVVNISAYERATLQADGWRWTGEVTLANPVDGAGLARVEANPFVPAHGTDILPVLYVGRLDRMKGVLELVTAFAAVIAAVPQATLFLVGQDGDATAAVRRRISEHRLQGRVIIAPEIGVDRKRLYGAYQAAEVCVLPSHTESFGMVVAEAMAAGAPVVATDVPALAELVTDGETGLLFPVGSVDLLAGAIVRLLRDRPVARAMGSAARQSILARCDLQVYRQRLLALYERVINAGSEAGNA